jgi:hypothetical protein
VLVDCERGRDEFGFISLWRPSTSHQQVCRGEPLLACCLWRACRATRVTRSRRQLGDSNHTHHLAHGSRGCWGVITSLPYENEACARGGPRSIGAVQGTAISQVHCGRAVTLHVGPVHRQPKLGTPGPRARGRGHLAPVVSGTL